MAPRRADAWLRTAFDWLRPNGNDAFRRCLLRIVVARERLCSAFDRLRPNGSDALRRCLLRIVVVREHL